MFRIQSSNNKSSSDVPREKYERNKNGGNIVVNSRNPLTCSRSCGVHWLTPEVLLWSRRGVLEEIRNTPRIYVRASFTWYTWCVCMCVYVCARKRSRQRSRFTGVLEGGATSSNQTRTELMTLSRRNFLLGVRTEIRVDSTLVKRNARWWSGTGRGGEGCKSTGCSWM